MLQNACNDLSAVLWKRRVTYFSKPLFKVVCKTTVLRKLMSKFYFVVTSKLLKQMLISSHFISLIPFYTLWNHHVIKYVLTKYVFRGYRERPVAWNGSLKSVSRRVTVKRRYSVTSFTKAMKLFFVLMCRY